MKKDCFNCGWFLFLGNTSEGVCICLKHAIQIEPNPAVHCSYWDETYKEDFHYDDIYDHDAVERQIQKNDQAVSGKE